MNGLLCSTLERLRSRHLCKHPMPFGIDDCGCIDVEQISQLLYDGLMGEEPFMASRFGSVELYAVANGMNIGGSCPVMDFIKGRCEASWWTKEVKNSMMNNAGFFPCTDECLDRFTAMVLEDAKCIDILGSWVGKERLVDSMMSYKKVRLLLMEPYWAVDPWTRALEGKKVLVVHPFAKSITNQYTHNRSKLFADTRVLPEFRSLNVIQAVQSIGGKSRFKDWFDALDFMKGKMDSVNYDVALIGCGAYGMSLAAHSKRSGKKAVHMGGALQLLFGIRGARWDNPEYGLKTRQICPRVNYSDLFNEYWIRPSSDERPAGADGVEGACYW